MLKQKTQPAAGMTVEHLKLINSIDARNTDYYSWLAAQGLVFENIEYLPKYYMLRVKQKQCFANSAIIALSTGFDYYEGYYVNEELPIPLPHAFNVDPATGAAFDATVQKFGFNIVEWFGVKVPREALLDWLDAEEPYATPLEYYYKKYIKKS